MKEVTRFKCDYCNRLTAKQQTMEKHEKACKHNPNCFNCYMCKKAHAESDDDDRSIAYCDYYEDEILENISEKCQKYDRDVNRYDERWPS